MLPEQKDGQCRIIVVTMGTKCLKIPLVTLFLTPFFFSSFGASFRASKRGHASRSSPSCNPMLFLPHAYWYTDRDGGSEGEFLIFWFIFSICSSHWVCVSGVWASLHFCSPPGKFRDKESFIIVSLASYRMFWVAHTDSTCHWTITHSFIQQIFISNPCILDILFILVVDTEKYFTIHCFLFPCPIKVDDRIQIPRLLSALWQCEQETGSGELSHSHRDSLTCLSPFWQDLRRPVTREHSPSEAGGCWNLDQAKKNLL